MQQASVFGLELEFRNNVSALISWAQITFFVSDARDGVVSSTWMTALTSVPMAVQSLCAVSIHKRMETDISEIVKFLYFLLRQRKYMFEAGDNDLNKTAKQENDRASHDEFLELADWLDLVTQALDRDFDVPGETEADLQVGLAHAEAALRQALSEIKLPK